MQTQIERVELQDLLAEIGEAGQRLADMGACEGAAGNLTVFVPYPLEAGDLFTNHELLELPVPAPALANGALLASGSGCRLRDLGRNPGGTLGLLLVRPGGLEADLFTSARRRFARLTSELNSHLAVHEDQQTLNGSGFQAVIHAQPLHLTYLSHVPAYQDEPTWNRKLLRWQPETIAHFPEGFGWLPFIVPGSPALMQANVQALRRCRLVVWGGHGVMARSRSSIGHACDLIEYAETAARYEVLNLASGEPSAGLAPAQIQAICQALNLQQSIF